MQNSKNLLFNLSAVQPIHSAKFHGGGSYGEVLFFALVKRSVPFSCVFDSRKYLNESILNICKEKGIPLFDISKKTPQEIIDENKIHSFYTPLYSLEKKWDIQVPDFIFTWHGVRALEMSYSFTGIKFARTFAQKLEALVRYRNIWKRFFYKPKYEKLSRKIAAGNVRVLTVSEHSKASIQTFFPELLNSEIPVLYSPMESFLPQGFLPPGIEEKKYFLLTSSARFEKNNWRAVQAFDSLIDIYKKQKKDFPFKMLLTGVTNPKIYSEKLKHKEYFVFLGYVENKELEFLHQNAYAFLFPSLNEGFGYPPVQSMRYGIPVAASGTTSVPEIGGDAVLYFDPYSVTEIRNRIFQLLNENIYAIYAKKASERYLKIKKRQEEDLDKAIDFILQDF